MARKLNDPIEEDENGKKGQATEGNNGRRPSPSSRPPPLDRGGDGQHGVRPRTPTHGYFDTEDRERRSFRRRLDSLNLDLPSSPNSDANDGAACFTTTSSSSTTSYSSWMPGAGAPWPYPYQQQQPMQDIQSEGQELYLHFFHERARTELGPGAVDEETRALSDLHDPNAHILPGANGPSRSSATGNGRRRHDSMNLENFQNPMWRQTGRALQQIAEDFAQSQERDRVRRRAQQVDIASLDSTSFTSLLRELFQGPDTTDCSTGVDRPGSCGITRERVIVLFFFCSDVAIEAIRRKLDGAVSRLTQWALSFIRDQVCQWVHANGGWSTVLNQGLNLMQKVAMIGMCGAVIACAVVYIKRNWK